MLISLFIQYARFTRQKQTDTVLWGMFVSPKYACSQVSKISFFLKKKKRKKKIQPAFTLRDSSN